MEKLTSKMCLFVKAYHHLNSKEKVFDDEYAYYLLGEDYKKIYRSLEEGINFFLKDFKGDKKEGVNKIVNSKIGSSILIRSAINREKLEKEISNGLSQYIIFASGYDTYAINNNNVNVYEIDYPSLLKDKDEKIRKANLTSYAKCIKKDLNDDWIKDLESNGFDFDNKSFGSLLGITYYLTKEEFNSLLKKISLVMAKGSHIVFDYPSKEESEETILNKKLAEGASENMKASYNYKDIENILIQNNFEIEDYFDYDGAKKYSNSTIVSPRGINYISAIKL